jgi:hypothetical protein
MLGAPGMGFKFAMKTVNVARIGQSQPDSGFGFRGKVLEMFFGVPSLLGSGMWVT